MPVEERRWPWYQQVVDATVALLGIGITVTMLVRDSWPVLGVVVAMICLGKVSATAALNYLTGRWETDRR
jgi:hypothetical protein